MRLCSRCRTAVENRKTFCPHCGAAPDAGPRATPSDPVPDRGWSGQLVHDLRGFDPGVELLILLPVILFTRPWLALRLILPLVAGGYVGCLIGGADGAVVGVIGAMVVFVGVVAYRDHRQGK